LTKKLNHVTRDKIKDLILETVKNQKPETAKQLIAVMQERHAIPPEQTTSLLIELEKEDHLLFTKQESPKLESVREYFFSTKTAWYWTTIALAIVSAIAVFTIPDTAYPIVYLRSALGIIFILFLPGFAFMKVLFPTKVPIKTSSENMDTIERVALSFGMSLTLAPIVGLILNYTPWGIQLTPIALSLLALTIVFATFAFLRGY
jgi:hypothetical protein